MDKPLKHIAVTSFADGRFEARSLDGRSVTLEAVSAGDARAHLGPMEVLLAALGACTAVDVREIMRKRRTPLADYRVELEGERARATPARYVRIKICHIARGEGVSVEELERAVHLSHEKYCSVAASLHPEIVIQLEVRLEQ